MENMDKNFGSHKSHLQSHWNCILPILLYGSECCAWAITEVDRCRLYALDQWCLWRLLGIKWYQFVSNAEVQQTSGHILLISKRGVSLCLGTLHNWMTVLMLRRSWLHFNYTTRLKETTRSPSDHMDEDSPKWPWVPQSHIDWSSQYGLESSTMEVAGCEWCYTLVVFVSEMTYYVSSGTLNSTNSTLNSTVASQKWIMMTVL